MASGVELGDADRRARDLLIARAEALAPVFRERAAATEAARQMSDATARDLFDSGLLRYFQPRRYGGFELDWGIQFDLSRIIGRACPATAWTVGVVGAHAAFVGRFGQGAQDDVWGKTPDALISTGSLRRPGSATQSVDGGYVLDGAWGFASGIDHATWAMVPCPVDAGAQKGEHLHCLVPRQDFTIDDTWHVAGMRGTGTKDVRVRNIFVPAHRALTRDQYLGARPPGAAVNPSYVYRAPLAPLRGSNIMGPLLGAAEGAYQDYVAVTKGRVGAMRGDRPAEDLSVQLRLSESAAELSAAALIIETDLRFMRERNRNGIALTQEERVSHLRDRTFAARLCLTATERLVRQMGASGIFRSNPVQRHFRDVSAMSTQIGVNWDFNMPAFARWALDLPPGDMGAYA